MNFNDLEYNISQVHTFLKADTAKAINIRLTIRNWLIGYYLVKYEQKGQDRAQYGSKLLVNLAKKLSIKGLTAPELSRTRQFYHMYSSLEPHLIVHYAQFIPIQILESLTQNSTTPILGSLTQKLEQLDNHSNSKYYKELFSKISYTHFIELIKMDDPLKRKFYELAIIKQSLSVRELERQISTMYYERIGLVENIDTIEFDDTNSINNNLPQNLVKSMYVFDFLNLSTTDILDESELENKLLNHIQDFILELGYGFCFEARQQRLLIDDEYYFVDLTFYHRILKCHILIELKVDKFKHENLSQLNSYVSFFNENIKQDNDNPTIGILLCTQKGEKMVEYALSGMEEKLFVSQYMIHLPDKEKLKSFIEQEIKNL